MNTKIINKIKSIYHKIKSSVIYYIKGLYHRFGNHNIFLIGGGLTFSFVTCIIPFVLIVFAILGKLLEVPEIENQINTFIEKIIPYRESAGFVKSIVHARITEFRQFRTLAGYLGAIGLFFAASGLVSSLRTILNSIFGIDKDKNVFIAKLRDFGIILLVVIIFLLSIGFISLIEVIRNLAGKIWFLNTLNFGFLKYFLLPFISFLIMFGIFYFIYYVIPYKKIEKPILLVSAFWAAFLWEIAKQLFGFYLAYSANLTKIYGAYVFIVAVVFWLYYSSVVIIIGAEIGQLFSERKTSKQSENKA